MLGRVWIMQCIGRHSVKGLRNATTSSRRSCNLWFTCYVANATCQEHIVEDLPVISTATYHDLSSLNILQLRLETFERITKLQSDGLQSADAGAASSFVVVAQGWHGCGYVSTKLVQKLLRAVIMTGAMKQSAIAATQGLECDLCTICHWLLQALAWF